MNKGTQQEKPQEPTALELPRCEYCGKRFIPRGPGQKYCKPAHKVAAYNERQKKKS